jgi:hypothetical protein
MDSMERIAGRVWVVADASKAKARNPSPGLEGVNDFTAVLPIGRMVALAESSTPLT